jgi:hypothetical protein
MDASNVGFAPGILICQGLYSQRAQAVAGDNGYNQTTISRRFRVVNILFAFYRIYFPAHVAKPLVIRNEPFEMLVVALRFGNFGRRVVLELHGVGGQCRACHHHHARGRWRDVRPK